MRYAKLVLISLLSFYIAFSLFACSQKNRTYYDPSIDAAKQLEKVIEKTKDRLILVQVGGDWCKWCVRLNKTIGEDPELLKAMNDAFEWVHVYYGKENKNEAAMQMLGNPTNMGFPIFVLLDDMGNVLRTITTASFEVGDGYDKAKLLHFMKTLETPEDVARQQE